MRLRERWLLAVLAAVSIAAPVHAATHNVTIQLTAFDPAILTVHVGDTVVWRNNSFLQHTVTRGNNCQGTPGGFNSGIMDPAAEFQFTFNSVGGYDYFCLLHCLAGMRGTITVEQAPVPVAPTTWGSIKALYATSR